MNEKPHIAIIGSGISGLSAAFQLHRDFQLTVYEKSSKAGGHTDTHDLEIESRSLRVDTGFIVFCRRYYPVFSAMLDALEVKCKPTKMSFSVHNKNSGLIYNATSLNKLFCQRGNLLRPAFYRMLFDLVRFYRSADSILENCEADQTIQQYLEENSYSNGFMHDHLFPMISALWSATPQWVAQYPVCHLVRFMQSHGMMKLLFRPQWSVVEGGSDRYVQALMSQLECRWKIGHGVKQVQRRSNKVFITARNDAVEQYDAVIFAIQPQQILAILDSASADEQTILGRIRFQDNHVLLHTDESIMPPMQAAWASWNTEVPVDDRVGQIPCTASYWMNELQGLDTACNIFTSLNPAEKINPDKVLAEKHYAHPIFDSRAVAAQRDKALLDGRHNSYFVGAYWGWGFHEDGARSALLVSQMIKQQFNQRYDAAA